MRSTRSVQATYLLDMTRLEREYDWLRRHSAFILTRAISCFMLSFRAFLGQCIRNIDFVQSIMKIVMPINFSIFISPSITTSPWFDRRAMKGQWLYPDMRHDSSRMPRWAQHDFKTFSEIKSRNPAYTLCQSPQRAVD